MQMQHPYPPPTDPPVRQYSKVLAVGLIWLVGVVLAAFSCVTWIGQGFPGKSFTGLICWFSGLVTARMLHRTLGMVTIMSLIYGLGIALTLAGLVFILFLPLRNFH